MAAKSSHPINFIIEKLTQQSYGRLLLIWFSVTFSFGVFYFLLLLLSPENGPYPIDSNTSLISKFLNSLYYSIITATSTGYGDIVPNGFSKLLASVQSFIALAVFAIFVTKLVSYKQELALREVHKLMFEDVFHNVREGLYIVRKDCDRFIRFARGKHVMTEEDWEDLTVMYRQTQSLLQKIPQFYGMNESQTGFYTIDEDRESLLHEAVFRTLSRMHEMLDVLSKAHVSWEKHEDSMKQLKRVVDLVDTILPTWRKESPYKESFNDIVEIHEKLKMLQGRE